MTKKTASDRLEAVPKSCKQCEFYKDDDETCRRYPPIVANGEEGSETMPFPTVDADDWCGEFRGRQ